VGRPVLALHSAGRQPALRRLFGHHTADNALGKPIVIHHRQKLATIDHWQWTVRVSIAKAYVSPSPHRVNPGQRDERSGKMPDQPSDPAANPKALRDQAQRIRGYARDLAGDPAAGRLDNFADELDARADALEHQSPSRGLESCSPS
jgi:hypothetical protein